jgi:hypothetical protein
MTPRVLALAARLRRNRDGICGNIVGSLMSKDGALVAST